MRELSLADDTTSSDMLIRGAALLGLDGKVIRKSSLADPSSLPFPVIFLFDDGTIALFGGPWAQGTWRLIDPVSRKESELTSAELAERGGVDVVVVRRKLLGPGVEPENFSLHFFLKAIKKYKRPLVQILLASCIVQIFALITPLFFQAVIDKVLVHYSTSTLHVLIIGIIIVILFDTILQYIRTYSLNHTSNRIDVELSRTVFSHLLRLPMSYFESRAAGQTVARVRELESIRAFLTGPALTAVLDVVFTGLFLAVMFFYSTVLSLVVLATIPLYVLTAILIRPVLQQSIAQKFYRGALCQQLLVESIIGIQTVKASAVENQILLEWDARLAGYVQTSFGASQVSALGSGIIQAISRLGSAAVLWLGAYAVMEGSLTVGGLVAFNIIATQISQPIIRLSQLWQDFQQVKVSIARLGDVLNAQPEPGSRAAVSLAPPRGLIQFRDVTFRYNPTGPDVLRNISFDVAPGQVVGIIGTSGSGKSTLAKLMQRFAIPQGGEILIDGHNLAHVDPAWIRRNTGVVLQESALFNRSVHDNIALANPAVARERVIAVAQLSGADEFIRRMPQGYDTIIEERGVNLSGGQKQRIAIARALIANPKILIFDEATSSLDYESEQLIRTNMQRIAFGRTVIIIAHRLTTVMNCDVIFGLKDGVIVEQGTHTDLIARPHGLYASLWSRQFGKPSR